VIEIGPDFASARVGGTRRRPPMVLLGWLVVLGGVVALGVSGRSTGGEDAQPGTGRAIASVGTRITTLPSAPPQPTIAMVPGNPIVDGPVQTNGEGPIQLQAQRHPGTVFVHGDVYAVNITWVFLSLRAADGRVAGWASVSVPGSATMVSGTGKPALRFDVELAVPADFNDGALVVQANAYNAHGTLVESTGVDLALAR
jgi:hypothetical protein